MTSLKKLFLLSSVALASISSFAATQGTLGATSTGSFTNTFDGTVPRQVQILGLQDMVVTTRTKPYSAISGGSVRAGISDKFCVVDTAGAKVQLTVSGSNDTATTFRAQSESGTYTEYAFYLSTVTGDTEDNVTAIKPGAADFVTPAAWPVTSAAACGDGNMGKQIHAETVDGVDIGAEKFPGNNKIYVDTMTILVTPL